MKVTVLEYFLIFLVSLASVLVIYYIVRLIYKSIKWIILKLYTKKEKKNLIKIDKERREIERRSKERRIFNRGFFVRKGFFDRDIFKKELKDQEFIDRRKTERRINNNRRIK